MNWHTYRKPSQRFSDHNDSIFESLKERFKDRIDFDAPANVFDDYQAIANMFGIPVEMLSTDYTYADFNKPLSDEDQAAIAAKFAKIAEDEYNKSITPQIAFGQLFARKQATMLNKKFNNIFEIQDAQYE